MWLLRSRSKRYQLIAIAAFVVALLADSACSLPPTTPASPPSQREDTAAFDWPPSVDATVDPCDDFYAFACNRWRQENPRPANERQWDLFSQLTQSNQMVIRELLERPLDAFKTEAELKAKLLYDSCVDEAGTRERLGAEPMQRLLRQIGGWNITESGNDHYRDWNLQSRAKVLMNRYQIEALFAFRLGRKSENDSQMIVHMMPGGLSLTSTSIEIHHNQTAMDAYLEYMVRVVVLLGADKSFARKHMAHVMMIERWMATSQMELNDTQSKLIDLGELQRIAPFLDWHDFLVDKFSRTNRSISEREEVKVNTKWLEWLEATFDSKVVHRKDEDIVLSNYMVWRLVRTNVKYLSKPFRDAERALSKALYGTDVIPVEPWRECVADVSLAIGAPIHAMFVRKTSGSGSGDVKSQTERIFADIRAAFRDMIPQLSWMDPGVQHSAVQKLDAITALIGSPDVLLDEAQIDAKYSGLQVDKDQYFENMIRVRQFIFERALQKSVDDTPWQIMPKNAVEALYTPTENKIVLPAGILQAPFYDESNERSTNFGRIGSLMGHQMMHGFDKLGGQYDKDGNFQLWWNNETLSMFEERTKCLVNQYNGYSINGKTLNGLKSLDGNIADNGGLKTAYRAFLRGQNVTTDSTTNSEQQKLFFLSFAQTWCASERDEKMQLQSECDEREIPFRYRVIGSLSNLPDFADLFKCKLGSAMNPVDKCEIW